MEVQKESKGLKDLKLICISQMTRPLITVSYRRLNIWDSLKESTKLGN